MKYPPTRCIAEVWKKAFPRPQGGERQYFCNESIIKIRENVCSALQAGTYNTFAMGLLLVQRLYLAVPDLQQESFRVTVEGSKHIPVS